MFISICTVTTKRPADKLWRQSGREAVVAATVTIPITVYPVYNKNTDSRSISHLRKRICEFLLLFLCFCADVST